MTILAKGISESSIEKILSAVRIASIVSSLMMEILAACTYQNGTIMMTSQDTFLSSPITSVAGGRKMNKPPCSECARVYKCTDRYFDLISTIYFCKSKKRNKVSGEPIYHKCWWYRRSPFCEFESIPMFKSPDEFKKEARVIKVKRIKDGITINGEAYQVGSSYATPSWIHSCVQETPADYYIKCATSFSAKAGDWLIRESFPYTDCHAVRKLTNDDFYKEYEVVEDEQ